MIWYDLMSVKYMWVIGDTQSNRYDSIDELKSAITELHKYDKKVNDVWIYKEYQGEEKTTRELFEIYHIV